MNPNIRISIVVALVTLCTATNSVGQEVSDTLEFNGSRVVCRTLVDKKPEPKFDLSRFIFKTIRYPDEARENNIQGTVVVSYAIDESGKIVEAKILESPHESLSNETLRLIGLMPRWMPGSLSGTPIKVYLEMPFRYHME